MRLRLELDLDNAAFDREEIGDHVRCGDEVARILRRAAEWADNADLRAGWSHRLMDANGNGVGEVEVLP